MKEVLFKIVDEGKTYAIYTNGEIEGFGKDAMVFNFFPQIEGELRGHRHVQQEESSCHVAPAARREHL